MPGSNWNLRRYLWAPALGCRGILQISPFRDVFVLHGAGVGGGSLGYANVLMEPEEAAFQTAAWRTPVDWGTVLRPHYATARRMLGVAMNPRLGPADFVLQEIAAELGQAETFRPVPVGTFFGAPGRKAARYPIPTSAVRGRRGAAAFTAGAAWSAAATMPRTRWSRTISGSPSGAVRRSAPTRRCATSGRSRPASLMARATRCWSVEPGDGLRKPAASAPGT